MSVSRRILRHPSCVLILTAGFLLSTSRGFSGTSETRSAAIDKGIQYLATSQAADGSCSGNVGRGA